MFAVRYASSAPSTIQPELEDAALRAIAAGARQPLEYIGAGMVGIVLLDARGRAYKVGRSLADVHRASLADEYEWLLEAHKLDPEHVVRPISWHPTENVLVKEYVDGRPFGWAPSAVHEHYRQLMAAMERLDWGAVEFKDNSYIKTETGFVLVDAGMASRLCSRLAAFVQEWLSGRRPGWAVGASTPDDLAFYLRREVQEKCLDPAVAQRLIEKLQGKRGRR